MNKPNVLWIVVDCLRADRCNSSADNPKLKAWNAMRNNGVCFSRAFSSASITPVSFGSMLTSLYHFSHGIYSLQGPTLDRRAKTIAEVFSENGYYTRGFLTGPLEDCFGLSRGFTDYECRDRRKTVHTDWWGELKKSMAEVNNMSCPTFTMLHLFEMHRPIQARDRHGIKKENFALYDLAWQQLDEKIAELLADLPENTIVIFTADHGERLTRRSDHSVSEYLVRKVRKISGFPKRPQDWYEHGFFPYDELHHVPLAIYGPGLPQGKKVDMQVRHIDIMPTVLELCGLTCPDKIHGRSLMQAISGNKMTSEPAYLYTGWCDSVRYWHGVRTEEAKYIEPAGHMAIAPKVYYFDLEHDPEEVKNEVYGRHYQRSCEYRLLLQNIIRHNPLIEKEGSEECCEMLSHEDQQIMIEKLQNIGYM